MSFSVQNAGEESPKGPVPLGMESGVIIDSQISASSVYYNTHGPQNGRLHFKGAKAPLAFVSVGWAADLLNTNQWLQVDLRNTARVIGIATQEDMITISGLLNTSYNMATMDKLTVSTGETVTLQIRYK